MDSSRDDDRTSGGARRMVTRRRFIVGAGAMTATGLVMSRMPAIAQDLPLSTTRSLSTSRPPRPSGTTFVLRARAGQPLLVNPNKGNMVQVTLPLAALGSVTSTVVVPLASRPSGSPVSRTIAFVQPQSGPAVNPNLRNVSGPVPSWGTAGPGSTDTITVKTSDGVNWAISSHTATAPQAAASVLKAPAGAPRASVDPASLPQLILEWTAADMYAGTADGATFASGARVGSDLSGAGNDLVVNAGDTITYHRGPVAGAGTPPAGLSGFPYIAGQTGSGLGCTFAAGPLSAWTVLASFSPGVERSGGQFGESAIFALRTADGDPASMALKWGNMAYTWDGTCFNNIYWPGSPFTNGQPVPTVVGWSSRGSTSAALPTMIAGSLTTPITGPVNSERTTRSPASIAGVDLPTLYGVTGLIVYAGALTPAQMSAAALRLAYVSHGEKS